MTHQCHDCKNFTDGKCCHETKASSQFKVGEFVLYAKTYHTYEVVETTTTKVLALKHSMTKRIYAMPHISRLRLATHEEVKAGHRINFNLNDAVATAFDDLGDDKHIENHVAPQCVIGGDE